MLSDIDEDTRSALEGDTTPGDGTTLPSSLDVDRLATLLLGDDDALRDDDDDLHVSMFLVGLTLLGEPAWALGLEPHTHKHKHKHTGPGATPHEHACTHASAPFVSPLHQYHPSSLRIEEIIQICVTSAIVTVAPWV